MIKKRKSFPWSFKPTLNLGSLVCGSGDSVGFGHGLLSGWKNPMENPLKA
jgi:hypothetical protein